MASRFNLTPLDAAPSGAAFPDLSKDSALRYFLAFDDTTTESAEWTRQLPIGWDTSTAPNLVVTYRMFSAITGTVNITILIESISPGDAINTRTTSAFDAANTVLGTTVPSAAGNTGQITIPLTNHSNSVAGDMMRIRMSWPTSGNTGDVELLIADLQDAA